MAKKVDHISLKKSTVAGKIPSSDVLVDGELAVNIAEGGEKIFLRNTKHEIVEFSSDKLLDKKYLSTTSGGTVNGETTFNKDVKIVYPDSGSTPVSLREVMVDNEMAVAAALNELDTRITEQKTDIDSIKTKEYLPLSGGTVNGDLTVTGTTEFNGDVKIVYPDSSSQTVSLREVMVKNEKVTAAALNDLNERNDELSAKVTEQKTDIDNLSQKYLPLSGGTMSGNIRYSKTETANNNTKGINAGVISPDDNEITATYSDSIILDKRNKGLKVNYNTLSLTNSEINLHEHSSNMGSVDGEISINAYGLNITNGRINLNQHKGNLGLPNTDITIFDGSISLSAETSATTISYDSITSSKFVKTGATADDILLGDGTTKPIGNFLQTSGGTVTGEATFSGGLKFGYPDVSSTPVSLRDVIASNEKVTAAALNDLNERNDELSAKVTEQKTDIDNLSQKYLPLSGGTMSGNIRYFEEESIGNRSNATYSLSGVTIERTSVGSRITASIIDNSSIKIAQKNAERPTLETATTISYNSVTSPQFVKTSATADDILLGDGTTKSVNDFLQTSGGTVTGDTTFTKDVKVVFPNSETPTSLVGAIVSNEKVTSAALNNLNERVDDHKSDIDNLKAQKNLPLSGGTVTGEATFSGGLKFGYPDVSSTPVSLRDVIASNEKVTAAALNDLNDKINNISVVNAPLIIKDGNKKYKVNIAKGVELGLFTEIQ